MDRAHDGGLIMKQDTVPFALSPVSVNVIAEALRQMPWNVADPIIKDMQAQLDAYLAMKAEVPQPELKLVNG